MSEARGLLQGLRFPEDRLEAVRILRSCVQVEGEAMRQAHLAGAGGVVTVRRLAGVIDRVLDASYTFLWESPSFTHGRRLPRVGIVAVGGYGRGDLNPFSDIDIVLLHPPKADDLSTHFMIELMHFLWDIRLPLSHSNRSIANCVEIARHELTAKTSFIESRPLVGDASLIQQFEESVGRELLQKGVGRFIQEKAAERNRRHAMHYSSVSLLEPNVKESPGGLRDYHTALWVGATRFGARSLEQLQAVGVITREEQRTVAQAYDFLLRVRTDLHFSQQRKSDVLAIEVQEDTALRLGYVRNGPALAVERFMRDYYLQAREMYHFCASALHRCRPQKRGIGKVLGYMSQKDLGHGFVVTRGELEAKEQGKDPFRERPTLLLEVFLQCQQLGVRPSEDLKALMRARLGLLDEAFRGDPEHSRLFMDILKTPHAAQALRFMHEVGVLGAYLPEFQQITCLVHHDLYHKYTVDEHTLRAVEYVEELPATTDKELKEFAKLSQSIPNPEVLKLALIYHDVGKTKGVEHVEESTVLAREAMERLGLGQKSAGQVELLVRSHLLMNHLAQRRDITDPKIIADFAETVKNVENLKLLCALTYADTRAVGPDIWTVWKGALLWELYMRTHQYFTQEEEVVVTGEALIAQVKGEVLSALSSRMAQAAVDAFFNAMPYKYILSTPAGTIAQHVQLIGGLKDGKLATKHTHYLDLGYSELMVCMRSKPGNFSKIAGTLAAMNINILGAQIYTRNDGLALDTLQIESLEKKPILDDGVWQRLDSELY
ncbi:MAG: [protein-PII] uridylyltransferase, partial [Nitrospinae bacterium]|nr:[protein-PII] uridylyltransferase [Nitrospinota bacterium]